MSLSLTKKRLSSTTHNRNIPYFSLMRDFSTILYSEYQSCSTSFLFRLFSVSVNVNQNLNSDFDSEFYVELESEEIA